MFQDPEEILTIFKLLNKASNPTTDELGLLDYDFNTYVSWAVIALVGVGYVARFGVDVLKNTSFWNKNSRRGANMKDMVSAYRGLIDLAKQQIQEIEEIKLIMTKIKESGDLLINLQNKRLEHFKVLRGNANPESLLLQDSSNDEMLDRLVQMIQGYSGLPSEIEEIKKLSASDINRMKEERSLHHEAVVNLFSYWAERKGASLERLTFDSKQKLTV